MWVKPTTGARADLYSDDNNVIPQRAVLRIEAAGTLTLDVIGAWLSTCAVVLASAVWQHLAWVFDGSLAVASRGLFYIDGVAQTTVNTGATSALNVPINSLGLGAYIPGAVFRYIGRMGEVIVTKNAMTLADVNFLYNRQRR